MYMTVKRFCILLFAVTALMALSAFAVSAQSMGDEPEDGTEGPVAAISVAGDVDRNGKVEPADARQALRFAVGLDADLLPYCADADYDGDGAVTPEDARGILRRAVGLEDAEGPQPGNAGFDRDTAIAAVLREKYRSEVPDGLLHLQSYRLLAEETDRGGEVTVWLIVCHAVYRMSDGPEALECGFVPTAITFSPDGSGGHTVKAYWTPREGADHVSEVRAAFPAAAAEEALAAEKYARILLEDTREQAAEYLRHLGNS